MRSGLLLGLIFFLAGSLQKTYSQGKIILLNGKEINFSSYTITPEKINYIKVDDTKNKTRRIDKLKVFSIQPLNGLEEVIYTPDTITSDDPSVDEVRRFVMGEQHANMVYHNNINKVAGGVVGLGGSLLSFYGGLVPALYTAVVGNFSPKKIIPASTIPQEIFNSDEFRYGYQKRARTKKIQQGFLYGIIGFAVGTTALTIYEHNK